MASDAAREEQRGNHDEQNDDDDVSDVHDHDGIRAAGYAPRVIGPRRDIERGIGASRIGYMATERMVHTIKRERRRCAGYEGHTCTAWLANDNNGTRCSACESGHRKTP